MPFQSFVHSTGEHCLNAARLCLAFLAAAILTIGQAQAQTLSDEDVRSFIDSMKAAQSLADRYPELERDLDHEGQDPDFSRLISGSLERLNDRPDVREQLEEIATDHGFSGLSEWGQVGDRVYAALFALMMNEESAAAIQQMEQSLAAIENNPNLSEAQKAQMRDMAKSATASMQAANNAPEADIRAVRPYLDEFQSMSEE